MWPGVVALHAAGFDDLAGTGTAVAGVLIEALVSQPPMKDPRKPFLIRLLGAT
jgi:hypothetical protein